MYELKYNTGNTIVTKILKSEEVGEELKRLRGKTVDIEIVDLTIKLE